MKLSRLLNRCAAAGLLIFLSSWPAQAGNKSAGSSGSSLKLEEIEKKWPNATPGQHKEYAYNLAIRAKFLPKLPPGSVVALDVPYVDKPFQGPRPSSNQLLDLYVPSGTGPFPLIIYIHGGAWKGGAKDGRGAEMAARWLSEGFAVSSVNYLYVFDAPFPGMFQDCMDSVAFLRAHAAEYHLDAARIGIIGESAGGNIAGVVSMALGGRDYPNAGPPVQAAVLWCGFYDLTNETGQWNGRGLVNPRDDFSNLYPNRAYDEQIARKMSPVYLIHARIPPVLIAWGEKDKTAPLAQSQMLNEALKKVHADVTLKTYPEYSHNLWQPDGIADALAFFRKHLQPQTPGTR